MKTRHVFILAAKKLILLIELNGTIQDCKFAFAAAVHDLKLA